MKNEQWKIVRTKPENASTQTMILFNEQRVGFVQSYSLGQNKNDPYETLLLEIACPKIDLVEVNEEEFKTLLGSKYAKGGEDALPIQEDLDFVEETLKAK